ncbi:MAG: hypothetical protein H0V17_19335 [Deltaproteobacteria bacterium]|nr:hypothetical protein [Deltaproteobacteria bacterium]
MRDQEEIERELFEAKQDLEQNLDQVVHKAKETIEVRARLKNAAEEIIRKHPLPIVLGIVGGMTLFGVLRRL